MAVSRARCEASPPLRLHGDLPGGPEEPRRLPVVEVLGLGHVGDPAAQHEGQEERVAERLVVGGQDDRPVGRDVLAPFDLDPPQQEEDRAQQHLQDPVGHGQRYRRLCCTALHVHPPGPPASDPDPDRPAGPGRRWWQAGAGPADDRSWTVLGRTIGLPGRGAAGRPVGRPVPGADRGGPAHRVPHRPRGHRTGPGEGPGGPGRVPVRRHRPRSVPRGGGELRGPAPRRTTRRLGAAEGPRVRHRGGRGLHPPAPGGPGVHLRRRPRHLGIPQVGDLDRHRRAGRPGRRRPAPAPRSAWWTTGSTSSP